MNHIPTLNKSHVKRFQKKITCYQETKVSIDNHSSLVKKFTEWLYIVNNTCTKNAIKYKIHILKFQIKFNKIKILNPNKSLLSMSPPCFKSQLKKIIQYMTEKSVFNIKLK